MSLPTDTRGKAGGVNFFKAAQGNNKILIVGPVITGYQYWKQGDGGVVRSREVFQLPLEGVRQREVEDKKTGIKSMVDEGQQFYWALPIYNFREHDEITESKQKAGEETLSFYPECYQLWQITQKGIRDELVKYQENEDWGDPTGKYTLTIEKSGEGLKTDYKVMANPITDAAKIAITEVMAGFEGMDIEGILFGK